MKIGIDARPLSYRLTGIGVYLEHLLDKIQQLDISNEYCLISNAPIHFEIRNQRWSKIEGKLRTKLLSTLWLQLKGPIIAYRKNFDLFWGPRHQLPLFLHHRVKSILTVHDVVHCLYPETMALTNFLAERLFFGLSLLRSHAIIADSQSTASDVQECYRVNPKKIVTIYPGAPLLPENQIVRESLDLHFSTKYFLFVGTLDPRKNFERIFAAFERIRPDEHNVHLIVVGSEGWKNRSFRKRIESHPLKEYIHLIGYVPRDHLKSLYKKALCLLFPSLYEGFGFPILEAMSCGTPVITSTASSLPEVAGNAALLVDPRSVNWLAEAMDNLLENENLRKHLSKQGLERVRNFSWERCARSMMRVFERIVGQ